MRFFPNPISLIYAHVIPVNVGRVRQLLLG